MDNLARIQMEIRQRMTVFARDIRRDPWGGSFWLLMLFSFAYGAIHALGPGHGKMFAASYFLNRPGGFRSALLFGNLTMFFHVLSATTLVLAGFYLLSAGAGVTMNTMGVRLELASYSLLCILGLGMTGFVVRDFFRARARVQDGRDHDVPQGRGTSFKGIATMALAAGMIPCPGAALVLTFSLTMGIPGAGLLSMLCISLGMGLTISATACLVVCTRGVLLSAAEKNSRAWNIIHSALALTGALCIAGLGAVMFLGAYARL